MQRNPNKWNGLSKALAIHSVEPSILCENSLSYVTISASVCILSCLSVKQVG